MLTKSLRWLARKIAPGALPDGCTLAPDFIFKSCCNDHDRAYIDKHTARKQADHAFLICMKYTAAQSKHPRWWRFMAHVYYGAVRMLGGYFW